MLRKKMLRDLRSNFGQFFSLFLLVLLAAALYAGFMADPIGGGRARAAFHQDTNLASAWLYGEGFKQENLEAVRALPFVEDAQLRMRVTGSAPEQNGAEIDLYLEKENLVNKPLTVEGADFDPQDPDGFWVSRNFAAVWDIQVGDAFTVEHNGVSITKTVKGIILSPEYEYMCASTDADTNFANIGYVYMDYDGFPVKDYILHLIDNEKISVEDIKKNSDLLDEAEEKLHQLGLTLNDLTKEALRERVASMSEEQLRKLLPYTQLVLRAEEGTDILEKESEIAEAIDRNYAVMVDEHKIPGIERLTAELQQHASFSYVFMAVFLAIALLIIATSMSRMVERQRTQIGTMNALGLSRSQITRHYLGFSFLVSLLGVLAGMALGYYALGRYIVSMFREWYVVPGWEAGADWSFAAVGVGIVLICVLAAWLSCRRLLRVAPSEALRPAPPKQGRRIWMEKLPLWRRLSFSARYNLRDISRYKLRAVMGVFGTAVGMMLLAGTLSALSMLDLVYDWTFEKIQHFSYEALLSEDMKLSDAEALREKLDGELVMQGAIEIAAVPDAVNREKSTETITVIEGRGLYRITDPKTNVIELPAGTVAVTRRLAERMGVQVGDTVYWHIYEDNTWHSATVGVINRTPENAGITMLREDFEKTDSDYVPSLLATNDERLLTSDAEGISTVYTVSELRAIYEENMQIIWVLVVTMVLFAFVMVVAVLYNSGSLSFHERVREFATLRVLGFSAEQIRRLLTRQNFWLSLVGVLVGAPFGRGLLEAMMNSNGENFDYYATIRPADYLLAGACVLLLSMAVSFLFTRRIRRLDLVETLKGAE